MSDSFNSGLDLEDLELQLLPSWAKQSAGANQYSAFEGASEGGQDRRRDRRGPGGRPTDRPPGARQPGSRPGEGTRRRDDRDRGRPFRGAGGGRGRVEREPRPAPPPLPDIAVSLIPEAKGVESLARQVRLTGRAYPVFEIAQLILRKPERYEVRFETKKGEQATQKLWLCNLDSTVWLSEADAVGHVLHRHFGTFYETEKIPTTPPKGTYTFVAQCGLSGAILGPPNFHDYQAKLLRLHASKFSRMPFEAYKARVRIVRDEAVVKKWVEDQSFKTEYVTLNVPEPVRLGSMQEVEKHFREVHLSNIIQAVEEWSLLGPAAQNLPALPLRQLVRTVWEEQRRFPLKVVGVLSQQLASHGLQFFKVNKTVTHVAVARPHYLDMVLTPVSDGIRRIVEFIDSRAGCTRRQLLEALVPTPPPAPMAELTATEPATAEAKPGAEAPPPPTPEQTAVTADLHWLIHQGHVIEFANGRLETAKKPKPKPVRPEKTVTVPTQAEGAATATGPASERAEVETDVVTTEATAEDASAPSSASVSSEEVMAEGEAAGEKENSAEPLQDAAPADSDVVVGETQPELQEEVPAKADSEVTDEQAPVVEKPTDESKA